MTAPGRRWGRAGVISLVLLSACSSAAGPVTQATRDAAIASRAAAPNLETPPGVSAGEVAIAPPPAEFTGVAATAPPPPPLVTPPPAVVGQGTGVWSVVVGINDYPGSDHDLEYARNDAADMDAALARAGVPAPQRLDLVDGQATAATIRRSVEWLVANTGPDSLAVFFYAGHVRKLSSGNVALVGADGNIIRDTELADALAPLRARHAWIVIAACYGGGFDEVLAPGRILTAAAGPNDLAYETTTYRRSYFGEYMIRRGMVQGLGGSTIQSAYAYAAAALQQEYPDRVPVQYDRSGEPVGLGTTQAPPPSQPAAPPALPPPRPAAATTTTSTTAPRRKQCLVSVNSWCSN